jgi:hypothetical protein
VNAYIERYCSFIYTSLNQYDSAYVHGLYVYTNHAIFNSSLSTKHRPEFLDVLKPTPVVDGAFNPVSSCGCDNTGPKAILINPVYNRGIELSSINKVSYFIYITVALI